MIQAMLGGIIRAILAAIGGNLAGQGWISDDQVQQASGAILTLFAIGWSVWQKSRTRTEPGGPYNPRAEVRRPLPKNRGIARPSSLVAACMCCLVMGLGVAAIQSCATRPEPFPDVIAEQPRIGWSEPVDGRPFLVRLLSSLRITPTASIRQDEEGGWSVRPGAQITAKADF